MGTSAASEQRLPLSIKLGCTLWVAVLVPVWIRVQGLHNFLWLSDIALLGTCVALWSESRLLLSMMALGGVLPELAWTFVFLGRLMIDSGPLEQSGYMFNDELPLFVRGLSLFHVFLPPLLVYAVRRVGYDCRALLLYSILTFAVLLACYYATDPAENLNFVFGFGDPPRPPLAQPYWMAAQMAILLGGAYWPTHALLKRWAP
ncbi:membrane-associated protein [Candidatus Laterigemmans baculatus]|uniref:membrane-associated protein n=1 Tax=Candidatus Laterigemmans baculatus TaxID=2770505 RepID=UPI0013DCCF91|nr:membrane-associated protein [Candidatus Laterigemmans baculatus]